MTEELTRPATQPETARPPAPGVADPRPEVLEDWKWVYEQMRTGGFERYRGQHIAVAGKKVLASASNPMSLREATAKEHHLDPNRLVLFYVEGLP